MLLVFSLPYKVAKEASYLFLFSTLRYKVVRYGKVLTAYSLSRNIATGLCGFRFGRQRRQGGPRGAIPTMWVRVCHGVGTGSFLSSLVLSFRRGHIVEIFCLPVFSGMCVLVDMKALLRPVSVQVRF